MPTVRVERDANQPTGADPDEEDGDHDEHSSPAKDSQALQTPKEHASALTHSSSTFQVATANFRQAAIRERAALEEIPSRQAHQLSTAKNDSNVNQTALHQAADVQAKVLKSQNMMSAIIRQVQPLTDIANELNDGELLKLQARLSTAITAFTTFTDLYRTVKTDTDAGIALEPEAENYRIVLQVVEKDAVDIRTGLEEYISWVSDGAPL
ncbi:MAG: hypothetical protein LQ338_006884 [Usnochroma carphineum]|nr:MAG: hypothetical protein LQ338_006884 [Usnochroma carphineum]